MEQVSNSIQHLARQKFELTDQQKQSRELLTNFVDRLEVLMTATRNYFQGCTLTDETADEYAADWVELVKKYGLERFEKGLSMARRWVLTSEGSTVPRRFFPLPSEIEQFITTKTDSPVIAVTDDNCGLCRGTGWQTLERENKRSVIRCECRKLVKRAQ